MNGRVVQVLSVCTLLTLAIPVEAQTTQAFTYQGQLRDSTGRVDGDTDFRFSLWDAATLGSQIGTTLEFSAQPGTTGPAIGVSKGLFQVELDFGVGAFDGSERWLEIAVRSPSGVGGFETLNDRLKLTAAPYAVHSVGQSVLSAPDGNPNPAVSVGASGDVAIPTLGARLFVGTPGAGLVSSLAVVANDRNLGDGQLLLSISEPIAPNAEHRAAIMRKRKPDNSGNAEWNLALGSGNTPDLWIARTDRPDGGGASTLDPVIYFDWSGNIGVGTKTPNAALQVIGDISASNFPSPSDARFKQDLAPLARGVELLRKARPVTFTWRANDYPDRQFPRTKQLGFVAQELVEVVPQAVHKGDDGYYSVDYARLTPVLTSAVQELDRELQEQKAENESLRAELTELRVLVEQLIQDRTERRSGARSVED